MFQSAVVITSLVLFGGAIGAPPGVAQQSPPSPCGLLQTSEIKAALHGTVGAGDLTVSSDGSASVCQWIVMSDPSHGYSLTLHVRSGFNVATFKQQRQSALGTKHTIVKLGDAAFGERYRNCSAAAGRCAGTSTRLVFVDVWILHRSLVIGLDVARDVGTKPLVNLARLVLARL
jgi:hypothetical protein